MDSAKTDEPNSPRSRPDPISIAFPGKDHKQRDKSSRNRQKGAKLAHIGVFVLSGIFPQTAGENACTGKIKACFFGRKDKT